MVYIDPIPGSTRLGYALDGMPIYYREHTDSVIQYRLFRDTGYPKAIFTLTMANVIGQMPISLHVFEVWKKRVIYVYID